MSAPNNTQPNATTNTNAPANTANLASSPSKNTNLFVDTKTRPADPVYNPYTASTAPFTHPTQPVHYVGQYAQGPSMYHSAVLGQSYQAPIYGTTGYAHTVEAPARLTGVPQTLTHTGYVPTYNERLVHVPGYQQRQVQVPTMTQTNVQVPTYQYYDQVNVSPGRVHTIQQKLPDKEYTYEHRTDTHWNEGQVTVPTFHQRDVVVPGYQQKQVQVPTVTQKHVQVPTYQYYDQVNVVPGHVHTIQEKQPDKEITYEHRTDTHWNERNVQVPTYQERDVVVPGYQQKQVQVPTVTQKNVQVPTYKYVDKVNVSPGRVHTIQEKQPDKEITIEHRTDTHWNERNVQVPTYHERDVVIPGYQEKQVQVPTVAQKQVQVPTYKYVDKVNVSPGRVHTIKEKQPDKEITIEHRTDTHWNERNIQVPTYHERDVVIPGYQEKQIQVPTVTQKQVQVPTYKYVDKVNVSPGKVHTIREKQPDKEYTVEHRVDTHWNEREVQVPTYHERDVVVPGYQQKQIQVPTFKEKTIQVPTYRYVDKVVMSPGRVHTIREKQPDKEITVEHRTDTHWNERNVQVPTYHERDVVIPGYQEKQIQVPTVTQKQVQVPTYKYVDKVNVSPGRVHTIREKQPDKEITIEHRTDTHWNERNVQVPTYQERDVVVPGYQQKQVQVPTVTQKNVQVPTYKYVDKVNVSPGRVHTIQEKLPDKEYTYEHRTDTRWNEGQVQVPTYQQRDVVVPGYQQRQVQVPTVTQKHVQVPTYQYYDQVHVSPGRVHTVQDVQPPRERIVQTPGYKTTDYVTTYTPQTYVAQQHYTTGAGSVVYEGPAQGYHSVGAIPQGYASTGIVGYGGYGGYGTAGGYGTLGTIGGVTTTGGLATSGFTTAGGLPTTGVAQAGGYADDLSPSRRLGKRRDILEDRNKNKATQ